MRFLSGLWPLAVVILGGYAMADEAAIGDYDWGRIVSAEAMIEKRSTLQSSNVPAGTATQKCKVGLDYATTDQLMANAQIYVLLDQVDKGRWLVYHGPANPEIELVVPVEGDNPQSYEVFVEAIAADDVHANSWTSYGVFPIRCDGARTTLRLLDDFDMDGTGGNLQIVETAE